MSELWFLIENNSHQMFLFRSRRQLKEFARQHGYKIKRSSTHNHTYYTESYVVLPTGEID